MGNFFDDVGDFLKPINLGGLLGDGGEKDLKKGRAYALGALESGEASTAEFWEKALPYLMESLSSVEGGFDKGLAEVSNVGASARQRTLDREKSLIGTSRQRLQSRGLGSTTVGTNLERGIGYDTNLALGQIDEQLAQLRSGLHVSKGLAGGQARAGIADAFLGRGQQLYGEGESRANLFSGFATNLASSDQFQTGLLFNLFGDAVSAAPAAKGGG